MSSNHAGQAYALTVITPIMPSAEDDLRAYLEDLDQSRSPLSRLARTHFGRWVILDDFVNDPAQPHDDRLASRYLIFTSNFDGDLDSYLDELCTELTVEAQEIWGRCVGCPAPAAGPALKRYLLHNQLQTGLFFAAYPHATVASVKSCLDLRERMIAFAINSQGLDPATLQAGFVAEFGS